MAKERISEFGDRTITEMQEEKSMAKTEQIIQDLWDHIKRYSIISEG